MRYSIGLVVFVFAMGVPTANGAVVRSVKFVNARPPHQIRLANSAGMPFIPDSLAFDSLRIVSAFQNEGWFDCQVKIDYRFIESMVDLKYGVLLGQRYTLKIGYEASGHEADEKINWRTINTSYSGLPATAENIENHALTLLDFCSDHGFPYAEIGYRDLEQLPGNIISLTAAINLGPKVKVQKIEFPGRRSLEQKFLETYCGFQANMTYSTRKMESISKKLMRAPFLKNAGQFTLKYIAYPQNGVVEFPITERPTVRFNGLIGVTSKTGRLYGKTEVLLSNLLGRGRQLGVVWAKKDKYSSQKYLEYAEPSVFNLPIHLRMSASQIDNDSLYIETGGALGVEMITSSGFAYKIQASLSQIAPESFGSLMTSSKNRLSISFGLAMDNRDYPENPRRGAMLELDWRFLDENNFAGQVPVVANSSYRQVIGTTSKFIPIKSNDILMAAISGKATFGGDFTVDKLFPVGGTGSLRGYDQDIYRTSRYAVATIEYRRISGHDGRAYLFADLAVMRIESLLALGSSETLFKSSVGAGIAAEIALGMATVEIGFPVGKDISEARLHFAIRTEID